MLKKGAHNLHCLAESLPQAVSFSFEKRAAFGSDIPTTWRYSDLAAVTRSTKYTKPW